MVDVAPSSIPDAGAVLESTTAETSAWRSTPAQSDPPAVGTTTGNSVPQTAHDEIAASAPAGTPSPLSAPSVTSDQATAPPAVTTATLVTAQVPTPVPTDAAAPVSDGAKRTAVGEPTNSSGILIIFFPIIVFGLALVGIVWLMRKDAAARSTQIYTDQPEYNPYEDLEFYRKLRQGGAPQNPSVNRPVKEML